MTTKWPNELRGLVPNPTELPLAVRDFAPGEGMFWKRLQGKHLCGVPDGMHTGGAWLSPDCNYVWKPLDGRPYPNSEFHYPTHEEVVLTDMSDRIGFPKNWFVTTITRADLTRRFLVRRKCVTLGTTHETMISLRHALKIEQAVRMLNSRGWELGDMISVGKDSDIYEWFLLDLSSAFYRGLDAVGVFQPNDESRTMRWFTELGFDRTVQLRNNARRIARPGLGEDDGGRPGREWQHVYASYLRPMNASWAQVQDAHYIDADYAKTRGVHTWVLTPEPLNERECEWFELTWGWSPLRYGR